MLSNGKEEKQSASVTGKEPPRYLRVKNKKSNWGDNPQWRNEQDNDIRLAQASQLKEDKS